MVNDQYSQTYFKQSLIRIQKGTLKRGNFITFTIKTVFVDL